MTRSEIYFDVPFGNDHIYDYNNIDYIDDIWSTIRSTIV